MVCGMRENYSLQKKRDHLRGCSKNKGTRFRDQAVTFITTFCKEYHHVENVLKRNFPILYSDKQLYSVLQNDCRYSSRQAPILGPLLSPSCFTSKETCTTWLTHSGSFSCGVNCRYCHLNLCIKI